VGRSLVGRALRSRMLLRPQAAAVLREYSSMEVVETLGESCSVVLQSWEIIQTVSRSSLGSSRLLVWGYTLARLWAEEVEGHIVVALEELVGLVVSGAAVDIGLGNVLVADLDDAELWVGKRLVGMANCREMCEALAAIDILHSALVPEVVLHKRPSWAKEDC
jgi:hypothetical protein